MSSVHDGRGTVRKESLVAHAASKRILELWCNKHVRLSCGDAMAPAVSFTLSFLQDVMGKAKEVKSFQFDAFFDEHTSQETVYEEVARPIIDGVLDGYNGTLFAYGQTGTGKTYTMMGDEEGGGGGGGGEVDPNLVRVERNAEMLAAHLHKFVFKKVSSFEDGKFEEQLHECASLFRFLVDKDLFLVIEGLLLHPLSIKTRKDASSLLGGVSLFLAVLVFVFADTVSTRVNLAGSALRIVCLLACVMASLVRAL